MVGIQIDKTYVSVLPRHFQLVRWSSIDVFGSEIFDCVSLRLPIDQWSIDLLVFHERFNVIGRHSFGISASKEGRDSPPVLAVVRLDLSHSLKRPFSAHVVGPLFNLHKGQLNLSFLNEHFAAQPQRLQIMQRSSAAFCFDVLGNQLIDSWLTFVLSECCHRDEYGADERNYKTKLHVNLETDSRHRSNSNVQRQKRCKRSHRNPWKKDVIRVQFRFKNHLVNHSERSACIGSTRMARRAGI